MGVNGLDRRAVIYGSQPSLNEPRYNQSQGFERMHVSFLTHYENTLIDH